jgi:hypothetical protein
MQSWDEIRLGLMAIGYRRRVLTIEITCFHCGVFRGVVDDEQDVYPCPVCQGRCVLGECVEGFTRHELPAFERVVAPLGQKARLWLAVKTDMDVQSIRAESRQIHAIAAKLQGEGLFFFSQPEVGGEYENAMLRAPPTRRGTGRRMEQFLDVVNNRVP